MSAAAEQLAARDVLERDLEHRFVSGLISWPDQYAAARAIVSPEDLQDLRARIIFEAIGQGHDQLCNLDGAIDLVLLSRFLVERDEFAAIGGQDGLADFLGLEAVPTVTLRYATLVKQAAIQRDLQRRLRDIDLARVDPDEISHLNQQICELRDLQAGEAAESSFQPLQAFAVRFGPGMPTESLPVAIRDMVDAVADAYQVPRAAAGAWALGVAATSVARTFEARPREGWREPLNLFTVAALPPASRKSAALRPFVQPLIEFERDTNEKNAPARAQCEQRVRMLEKRVAKLENDYAKAAPEQASEVFEQITATTGDLSEAQVDLARVSHRTLFGSDITPEAAAGLMARNGEKLAIISAEGDEFFGLMRRYSMDGAANQDFYLKGHAGDGARVDRKNGTRLDLEAPALSLVLAVQPVVIDTLREDDALRRRGMVARFVFSVPAPTVGRRMIAPPPIPQWIEARYTRVVRDLLTLQGDRIPIAFDKAADAELRRFEQDIEPRLGDGGDLEGVADWAGKLSGLIARLAGIFHCVDQVDRGKHPNDAPVTVEIVRNAIIIGTWALAHALVALSHAEEGDPHALRIWRWVSKRPDPGAEFSARDAFYSTRSRESRMEEAERGLAALVDRGYLRRLPQREPGKQGGRPPSPRYIPNPEATRLQ